MLYLMFTYPNCQKCDALKQQLQTENVPVSEYNLVQKESKLKIRDFLDVLKRDDTGGIMIPTLIVQEAEEVKAVITSQEELADWLKSKG